MEKEKDRVNQNLLLIMKKISNRRVIVNEFNKYFELLATNLNVAYNEIGVLTH